MKQLKVWEREAIAEKAYRQGTINRDQMRTVYQMIGIYDCDFVADQIDTEQYEQSLHATGEL